MEQLTYLNTDCPREGCVMNHDWFLRILGVLDETIEYILLALTLILLALFISGIVQMQGVEIVRSILLPRSHG